MAESQTISWHHAVALAVVAIWAWGAGFWMGSYFVPWTRFDALAQRVGAIEMKVR